MITNQNNKVKLESLIRTEVSLTNLRDWKRSGTIYSENNLDFAFIYLEFSGDILCYLPLINKKEILSLDNNIYYLEFDKSLILKYSPNDLDLDFTPSGVFVKYNLFLEYLKTVPGQ